MRGENRGDEGGQKRREGRGRGPEEKGRGGDEGDWKLEEGGD